MGVRKELSIRIFEDDFGLNADGEDNKRHDNQCESLFPYIAAFKLALNLGDRYKQLLLVVLIERELVYVPEHTPVHHVSYKPNESCHVFAVNLVQRFVDVLCGNRWFLCTFMWR